MRQEITCFSAKDFASKEESIMKAKLKKILRREGGFTLTELAVAMLVVGILSAIAVPSFLGARNTAFDKEAQAAVDAALVAAKVHYATYGDFSEALTADCAQSGVGSVTDTLAEDLQRLDPNLDFVYASVASNGPRKVSVQANTTWNANNESLGCQAFYATALSRSGTCWIGRITVEGKYLLSGSTSPIVVQGDKNTENTAQASITNLAVNGNAYAAFKPQSPAADQTVNTDAALTDAAASCSGLIQGTGSITDGDDNVVMTNEYYDSWRNVINADGEAGTDGA
jgi:prepilin-type N-terminal cleavage/methylation domain-containing protein